MTTRVDFYILAASEPASRLQFACRLTEKAYNLQHKVYAHTASAADAQRLDEMLWTFSQGSFVPHQILGGADEERAPVNIGMAELCKDSGDLLINLTNETPDFVSNFARVAEIIDGQDESRQAGRERFKQYRELGLEPVTHNIN
jgi:DNA polymerase-3 subunit chi